MGVTHAQFHRVLRYADGACGGLDASGLEGLHQLLEALAFLAAQELRYRDLEIVETDLVLFHTSISEYLDLAARHALGWEGVFRVVRARFFGEEHGKAFISGFVGIGSC